MVPFLLILGISLSSGYAQNLRPCALSDYACMRYVLSSNSDCTTGVWGAAPAQVTQLSNRFEVPYVNASYVDQYVTTKNINNCVVADFYINRTANVAVLAIYCPNLILESNRAAIQHYPRGQDKYYSGRIVTNMAPTSFTTNLYPADNIDFCNSFTFAYITGRPKYKIYPNGPGAFQFVSSDVNGQQENLLLYMREEFVTRAAFIFRLFVNSLICDFGCN